MKIVIASQDDLIKNLKRFNTSKDKLQKYAFIRISSKQLLDFPFEYDENFFNNNIIEFNFSDVEEKVYNDNKEKFLEAELREEEITGTRPRYSPITIDEVKEIIKFVKKQIENDVEILFIHCDAGITRSPTIGYCIAKYILKDEKQVDGIINCPSYVLSPTIINKFETIIKNFNMYI